MRIVWEINAQRSNVLYVNYIAYKFTYDICLLHIRSLCIDLRLRFTFM